MKVVIITGGSRGIGASTAVECASRGFGVILTYNKSPLAAAAVLQQIKDIGGQAIMLPLDVGNVASFDNFREKVEQCLSSSWNDGQLVGLVNNAGYGVFKPIESISEAEFDGLFNVHLKGPFFLTQCLLPLLGSGTSIVNVTSATTRVAFSGVAPYASFKGGLDVLTRYMAKEFGYRGIRVNAVSPGAIRTELGGGLTPEFESLLAQQTALSRVGEPQDVARVIATLLGDDGAWINAQTIEVSGGYVI